MRKLLPILLVAASAVAVRAAPTTWAPSPVVVLTLRPAVAVRRAQATVRDVASLEGGSLAIRQRIGTLDLIDTPPDGGEAVVSSRQVVYRLLLAGLQAHEFRVEGVDSVHIGRGSVPTITPVGGVSADPPPGGGPDRPPASPPPLLHKGLVGGKELAPVLVKCRDVVHMVTYIGGLKVVTNGEALEEGREGQVIRLRNVDSSRLVRGRVVDRAIVEVDFVRSKP